MKKHLKNHSQKEVDFKCDDCAFVGESDFSMEITLENIIQKNMDVSLRSSS